VAIGALLVLGGVAAWLTRERGPPQEVWIDVASGRLGVSLAPRGEPEPGLRAMPLRERGAGRQVPADTDPPGGAPRPREWLVVEDYSAFGKVVAAVRERKWGIDGRVLGTYRLVETAGPPGTERFAKATLVLDAEAAAAPLGDDAAEHR
jgi:hypothetical protein